MSKKLIPKQFHFKKEEIELSDVGEVNGYVIHKSKDGNTIVMLMCNNDDDWDYFTLVKIERKAVSGKWVFKMIASPISKEELHFPVPKTNSK